MLTVRLLPRRGGAVRAAVAAIETTAALVLGHTWAGGTLPSPMWIGLMGAAVFLAGLPVLAGRLRLRHAVPGLVALQLLLHAWLTVLAPMPEMGLAGSSTSAHASAMGGLLAPDMLVLHVAGAVFTALLWEARAQVVEVLVTWSRPTLPPVPRARRMPAHTVLPRRRTTALVALAAPRRGPPVRGTLALAPA